MITRTILTQEKIDVRSLVLIILKRLAKDGIVTITSNNEIEMLT